MKRRTRKTRLPLKLFSATSQTDELGLNQARKRGRKRGRLPSGYGIDLSEPVRVVQIPPPDKVSMHVKGHGYPGNFLDPIGGQSGDALGLNDDSTVRRSVTFDVPNTTPKQTALVSGNGPIIDDWTDPSNPVATHGGGTQMTIDDTTKSVLTPQPQPW